VRFTVTGDRSQDELISNQLRIVTEDVLESPGVEKVVASVLGDGDSTPRVAKRPGP